MKENISNGIKISAKRESVIRKISAENHRRKREMAK
jgi:hypothetical protein